MKPIQQADLTYVHKVQYDHLMNVAQKAAEFVEAGAWEEEDAKERLYHAVHNYYNALKELTK